MSTVRGRSAGRLRPLPSHPSPRSIRFRTRGSMLRRSAFAAPAWTDPQSRWNGDRQRLSCREACDEACPEGVEVVPVGPSLAQEQELRQRRFRGGARGAPVVGDPLGFRQIGIAGGAVLPHCRIPRRTPRRLLGRLPDPYGHGGRIGGARPADGHPAAETNAAVKHVKDASARRAPRAFGWFRLRCGKVTRRLDRDQPSPAPGLVKWRTRAVPSPRIIHTTMSPRAGAAAGTKRQCRRTGN